MSTTAQGKAPPNNSVRHVPDGSALPARLRRAWWAPLAFVAFVLVALTGTPVIVAFRVRRLRAALTEGSDEGRAVVNDLDAAIATQMLLQQERRRSRLLTATDSASLAVISRDIAAAVRRERADEASLDLIVRRMGPDAMEQFAVLRTLVGQWYAVNGSGSGLLAQVAPVTSQVGRSGPEAINAAERLGSSLTLLSRAQRTEIQRLERLDVVLALVLAPLAAGAAVALYWTGRRVLFFAHTAESRREQLVQVLESKAALLRGVTHDLKNPLGAAYGYGELLSDGVVGPLAPPQQEIVKRMQSLLTVSLETVNDLMDLYRSETEGLRIQRVTLDVAVLVASIVADFTAEARQAGIALAADTSAGHSSRMAYTDPTRVRQILGNLVSNAIKYTPAGGTVSVSVHTAPATDATVEIEVRDSGPGIAPSYQERIFEEFFRVPGVESVAGTGVGLAISRRLARILGGDIAVSSPAEGGSTFTLSLPCNAVAQR